MEQPIYTNELTHYGIKGQKWGVRRYQKKDGTLTSSGKKRYSSNVGEKVKKAVKKKVEKSREQAVKRREAVEKSTDLFGVRGVAAATSASYAVRKAGRKLAVDVINSAANAYIKSEKGGYYAKQGAHYVRKAAIMGLSYSEYKDQYMSAKTVAQSWMYASSGKRNSK